jgi:hypothetical protein
VGTKVNLEAASQADRGRYFRLLYARETEDQDLPFVAALIVNHSDRVAAAGFARLPCCSQAFSDRRVSGHKPHARAEPFPIPRGLAGIPVRGVNGGAVTAQANLSRASSAVFSFAFLGISLWSGVLHVLLAHKSSPFSTSLIIRPLLAGEILEGIPDRRYR